MCFLNSHWNGVPSTLLLADRRWFSLSFCVFEWCLHLWVTSDNSNKGARNASTVTISKLLLAQLVAPVVLPFIPPLHSIRSPIWLAFLLASCVAGLAACAGKVIGYELWGWPMMDISYEAGQWWISTIWLAKNNWLYVLASISCVADSWGNCMHVLAWRVAKFCQTGSCEITLFLQVA